MIIPVSKIKNLSPHRSLMEAAPHLLIPQSRKGMTSLLPLLIAYFLKNIKNIPIYPSAGSQKDALDFLR
jgi:hypothetical protein